MLKLFRKKRVMKAILWGLAVIIIPAFVLWGSGSLIRDKRKGPGYVGLIDGKKVSFKEFFETVSATRSQIILNYWYSPEVLRSIIGNRGLIGRLAWQRLIFLNEARANKIKVSDREVVQFIRMHPLFMRDGMFDKEMYEYTLKNNFGTNARGFEETLREYIQILKLQNSITKDLLVPDEEVLEEYRKAKEKLKVKYVIVENINFAEDLDIDDGAVEEHYQRNKRMYIIPAVASAEYAAFDYNALGGDIAAIRKARELSMKCSNNPAAFEKLAQKEGLRMDETGFFAYDSPIKGIGDLQPFRDAAFGLQKGMVSDVIIPVDPESTECYVLKVTEKIPQRGASLTEARPEVVKALIKERSRELGRKYAEELSGKIAGAMRDEGLSFEKAAEISAGGSKETDFFLRSDSIEEIGKMEALWDAAFGLEEGGVSGPIEVAAGSGILFRSGSQPIDKELFEKEKEEFAKRVAEMKRAEKLEAWLRETAGRKADLKIDLDDSENYR
ncbi:SurA N-terminal domain-containing protein [Candidatus Omnitrophota bacterium]